MYIRNYEGNMVKVDVSKFKNEKVMYSYLWKLKYNKKLKEIKCSKDKLNNSLK